jgi:hypothetical protein
MRFTIRDLLWLMALIGALAGWYAYHRRSSESYKIAIEERDNARKLGGVLVTTMRADGYGVEGPHWTEKTVVRVMSKPKPNSN